MKIEAMVQREDFYRINENTLKRYYKSVHGKEVEVKTKRYSLFNRIIIYPFIGTEMTRVPGKKVRKYLLNEYNVRNSVIRYVIAKAYVLACFFSFGVLGRKGLAISDRKLFHKNMAVIPANRKIRIYDFKSGTVDAIVKDTFTKKYFNNELEFRLNSKYDFVLPVKEHGGDWYREDILQGRVLARITEEPVYQQCLADAVKHIGALAKATLEYSDAPSYSTGLYKDIVDKMETAKANKHIDCYELILEIAKAAAAKAALLEAPLPTVESHGDLQAGNVWFDSKNKKTYILDWETHERRSVWYDCATLLLSTRRAGKLKDMMDNRDTQAVKDAVLHNDSRKEYNMLAVMGIITLEDILFYLDDMLELPQDFGGDIFNRLAGELDAMGWRQT